MRTLKLIALVALAFTFSHCKSPNAVQSSQPSLLEVTKILQVADSKFAEYTKQPGTGYKDAIMLTSTWLGTQPTVANADPLDSTYIYITLKSGLVTTFSVDTVDDAGYSIFRGGGSPQSGGTFTDAAKAATNEIKNKKILIYAAAYNEFYKPAEMDKLISLINSSTLGLTVTLLKDAECTYDILSQFGNYGVVIIDTHGQPDALKIGTVVDTALNNDEELLKQNVNKAAGAKAYELVLSGDLRLAQTHRWITINKNLEKLEPYYSLYATTKYIGTLPEMPSTILFGNMCYSGQLKLNGRTTTPMRTAMLSRNPISYYCYALDNGSSATVFDLFSKQMELSLIKNLAIDYDSTGIAHQQDDGTEFYDEGFFLSTGKNLYFKHFGHDDYSYQSCMPFTDARDGEEYCTVKIGTQTWMSQNLRYNAPGSLCYDDDPAKCITYGKLYDWETLMQGASASSSNPSGVQGVCPKGWHIPSSAEYTQMTDFLGGKYVAAKLKAVSPLWEGADQADNSSGFSALPGGTTSSFGSTRTYQAMGTLGAFGTTDEATIINQNDGYNRLLIYSGSTFVGFGGNNKMYSSSCRCLKD
ncbi:MAG: FISUMP domain-containing protein [Ignavibacteriota bacterium]